MILVYQWLSSTCLLKEFFVAAFCSDSFTGYVTAIKLYKNYILNQVRQKSVDLFHVGNISKIKGFDSRLGLWH